MSLIFTLDNKCGNCFNEDKIYKLTVSYRCSKCNFINCLMCNKIHDNACDMFYKNNKNISIISTSLVAASESVPHATNNKLKRSSVNIQDEKKLSVSNSEALSSATKKPKIMNRRYTIAVDSVEDKVVESDFKCNTCNSYFSSKNSLARHMKSIKHATNVKNLKVVQSSDQADIKSSSTTVKLEYVSNDDVIEIENQGT